MIVPRELRDYRCAEHFESPRFRGGVWSEPEQLWIVVPMDEIKDHPDRGTGFLTVGRPGVDGIELGYRRGMSGLWAYYPIEDHFELMADTLDELVSGWLAGTLTV